MRELAVANKHNHPQGQASYAELKTLFESAIAVETGWEKAYYQYAGCVGGSWIGVLKNGLVLCFAIHPLFLAIPV
jgi:hypothetical protein